VTWAALLLLAHLSFSFASGSSPELLEDLARRRQAVVEQMNHQGVLILFSGEQKLYSGDVHYEFRQENNFFYLTAIPQPGTVLVLMPQNTGTRELLFLPKQDPGRELWNGKMLDAEEASELSGISTTRTTSDFEPFIESLLYGRNHRGATDFPDFLEDLEQGEANVFLLLDPKPGLQGEPGREFQFANRLRERFADDIRIKDSSPIFRSLRAIKSRFEIQQIQTAIDITVEAHIAVMRDLHPGAWEYEIEALMEYMFKKRNSSDWAFPSIIASGPNATTLHHRSRERQIRQGELLLMDTGAEYNHYAADITRTIPAGGRFTPQQSAVYQLVLDAQEAVMALVKPGATLRSLNHKALEVLGAGLKHLGLTSDNSSAHTRVYFPHGVSHFLGMDVHDVSQGEILKPNMVLTVEPGIYIRHDTLDRLADHGTSPESIEGIRPVFEQFVNIGVRIEDDLLVTEDGFILLSAKAPRTVSDIEALVPFSGRP